MTTLNEIIKTLRPISFYDRFRAKVFKCPSTFGGCCDLLSRGVLEFLNGDIKVDSVCIHNMKVSNSSGKAVTFWVANYPYSYGSVTSSSSSISWDAVIKLREIHLLHKDLIINNWIKENSL